MTVPASSPHDAIRITPTDNVAVCLRAVQAGEPITVSSDGELSVVRTLDPVPMGHKVALIDMARGDAVRKYGEKIGTTLRDVRVGEHLHLHNMGD